jgi:hypothetical protein
MGQTIRRLQIRRMDGYFDDSSPPRGLSLVVPSAIFVHLEASNSRIRRSPALQNPLHLSPLSPLSQPTNGDYEKDEVFHFLVNPHRSSVQGSQVHGGVVSSEFWPIIDF